MPMPLESTYPSEFSRRRGCITAKIEGPGISRSECPLCRQPVWKKDLKGNAKYASLVSIVR